MWELLAEPEEWLKSISKVWAIGGAILTFVVGTLVSTRVNDKGLRAAVRTIKEQQGTIKEQGDNIALATILIKTLEAKVHMLEKEINLQRKTMDRNSGAIERLRGKAGIV